MKKIVILSVFTLLVNTFYVSNVKAETLKNAIEKAYNYSEVVGIKREQADFGKINRDTSILAMLPTISANYTYNKVLSKSAKYEDPAMMAMSGGKEYEYTGFLEDFGLLFIQKYMDVIYNEKALEVYKQMGETLEKKVKKVSVMKQYGAVKNDKVVLAEAQFYKNKADEIQTQSTLDKTKMDYKIMTGEEPVNLEIPNLDNAKLPANSKEDFIQIVLAKNSKLRQSEDEMISQKNYAIIQSFDMLPAPYTETAYMHYKLPGMMKYNAWYTGIGVAWTINGPDNRLANFRKEYATYRIADLNYSLTRKQTEQDAGYAWDQYFAMLELVKATKKALKASTDSLKEVKVSVATGTATFIDEMDVENQYLEANLNYLNAQKALILSYYKMFSMTGVGKLPVV